MNNKSDRAGCVILSAQNKGKIVLLYRSRENDWTFPKGHVEKDEDPEYTAIRESKEETGLDVKVIKELPEYFYISPSEGETRVKMFLALSEDDSNLKTEFPGDKIEILFPDEAKEKITYDNLKMYCDLIKE
jgi:8-oxo-dGTP pyrophosphatase MutT (NUDIX family)